MATEFVNEWNSKIELSMKARKKFSSERNWETYRRWYRGDYGVDPTSDPLDYTVINEVFGVGKSLIPRLYFKTPSVSVTPRRPEFAAHARVVEAVDNWLIQELLLKYTIKKSALDSFACGTGVIKLGYDSEYGFDPSTSTDIDTSTVTQHSAKSGRKIEYSSLIKPGLPWAMRVRPEDVLVPFGYDDPWCLPWVGFMVLRPLNDVKEDIKYNKNRFKLKGGYIPALHKETMKITRDNELYRMDTSYCLLYEIRDYARGRMYVICEDEVLFDEIDPLQIEGLPVEFIRFNDDMEYFWGISDIQIMTPQILELNQIKAQAAKNRTYSLIKFLYQKGAIRQEELDKLLSNNVNDAGAGVEVDAEVLSASVLPLQPHSLTGELEQDKQQVLSDIREVLGLSRNSMGEYIPMTSKTATEAKIVEGGVDVRMDERRDHVADVLSNIIRKWNQFIFKYWTEERVIEITGVEGERAWIEYTGDQLKGEYFLKIDPESGIPITRDVKYKYSQEIFKVLNNDPLINQYALRKQLLRQYDWVDPEASLLLQPQGPQGMPQGGPPGMPPGMGGMGGMMGSGPGNPLPFDMLRKGAMKGRI